jgi:phage shock protein PspC (stress-responsive transcriptional regulator)
MKAPPREPVTGAPFRRRAAGRLVAGVAGGIADHFDIRALWPRLAFLTCGAITAVALFRVTTRDPWEPAPFDLGDPIGTAAALGVVAYVVLWLTTPRVDRTVSMARRLQAHFPNAPTWLGVALFVIGGAVLGSELGLWRSNVIWALLLIGAGVLLFRRDASRSASPAEPAGAEPALPPPEAAAPLPVVRRTRPERSPLGWFAIGVMLLIVGAAAILANLGVVELQLQQFPALSLLVLAAGLIVGAFWGRARWLILPSLVTVPVLLVTSLVHVPLDGGFGEFRIEGRDDPSGTYRRTVGNLSFDLLSLAGTRERVEIIGSTALGDVWVNVPHDALVIVRASASYGGVWAGRHGESGVESSLRRSWEPRVGDGSTIVLDVETGIGNVYVYREPLTKRERRELRRQEREDTL